MRTAIIAALFLCLAAHEAAAFEDEGLSETVAATDTIKNGDEDDGQTLIQETDEDLTAFVTDYIRKDIQLKGAFLIEDRTSKALLRLELAAIEPAASAGANGARTVTAHFKDGKGTAFTIVFHLQSGPWGGLDIFKLELKARPAQAAPGKKKGG